MKKAHCILFLSLILVSCFVQAASLPLPQHELLPQCLQPQGHDLMSILAVAVWFLMPFLGIHRVVMGGSAWLILAYVLSFGGFFMLLPVMDLVRMIVEPDHYRNNSKFLAALGAI